MNADTPKILAEYLEENKQHGDLVKHFVIGAFLEFQRWWEIVGKYKHATLQVFVDRDIDREDREQLWMINNHPDFLVWEQRRRW